MQSAISVENVSKSYRLGTEWGFLPHDAGINYGVSGGVLEVCSPSFLVFLRL